MFRSAIIFAVAILFVASAAHAQSFEAGAHVAVSRWSEFEGTDVGIGGRFTWKPTTLLGVEADLTWYPAEFPPDSVAFSGSRVEGLFGVTLGPRVHGVRPFAKVAFGFLRSSEAPAPFPCIAIFPPPLGCLMGAGHTMPAIDLGGGIGIDATSRTFFRVDAGARMLQYPGPSFRSVHDIRNEDFWGTALRVTVGGGIKF